MTTIRLDYTSAVILRYYQDGRIEYDPDLGDFIRAYHTLGGEYGIVPSRNDLLFEIPEVPAQYYYKKLIRADVFCKVRKTSTKTSVTEVFGLPEPVDIDTVVYSDLPGFNPVTFNAYGDDFGYTVLSEGETIDDQVINLTRWYSVGPAETAPSDYLLRASIGSKSLLQSRQLMIWLSGAGERLFLIGDIYVNAEIDEDVTITSQVKVQNAATSGWLNPAVPNTFVWEFTHSGDYTCYADFVQQSGTFYWRAGTSGNWTAIAVNGAETRVVVPANTFPGGTIQWYVSATDTQGTTTQTEIYTITTEDSEAFAIPDKPVNTAISGNAESVFEWYVRNDTGSVPSGADLQYSTDLETWIDLTHVTGGATYYTVPADTFPSGNVYWRVRAYNRDGVAGQWSDTAAFLCIKAPDAPSVTVDAVPFATIQWQSSDQLAYRITVDNTVYGVYFGAEKRFSLPDYLNDGNHYVSVEIQGQYGLWSNPGTASFSIRNNPGDAITLSGTIDFDANLTWESSSAITDFYIYRDDKKIGHTNRKSFVDRRSTGYHLWFVINRLPDGNYTRSNTLSETVYVNQSAISALDGGNWVYFKLSEDSLSQQTYLYSRTNSVKHITGTAYPYIELSPYVDETVTFEVSFATEAEASELEALYGQVVIAKTKDGNVIVGALVSVQKSVNEFYRSYSFSLRKVHWEDYVDDQNS